MPSSLDNEVATLEREWTSAEDDYETLMVAYDEDEPGHDATPALDIDDYESVCLLRVVSNICFKRVCLVLVFCLFETNI